MSQREYTIRLVEIEVLDNGSNKITTENDQTEITESSEMRILPSHRFWHYEIRELNILRRHQSPEKVTNQDQFYLIATSFLRKEPSQAKV